MGSVIARARYDELLRLRDYRTFSLSQRGGEEEGECGVRKCPAVPRGEKTKRRHHVISIKSFLAMEGNNNIFPYF